MKLTVKIFFILLVFCNSIYSITTKTMTINPSQVKNPNKTHVFDGSNGGLGTIAYSNTSIWDIGQHYHNVAGEDNLTRIYVSGFYFSLSQLPPSEYVINYKLRIILKDAEGGSFTAHVKQLPTAAFSSDAETVFDEIYDATKLFEFDYPDTTDYNISSNVISNISDGFIKFGVSQNPNTSYAVTKKANIKSIQIIVTYNEYYNMVAKNVFEFGNIGVGKNTPDSSRNSPYSFTAKETDNINLQAYENQTYAGYNWIWNDTGSKSKWEKKLNGNYYFISNDQSKTYLVQPNDNEAAIIANLKKVCNFTFTNNFSGISETFYIKVNGSTVSAPTGQYQFIEGDTAQVEANQNRTYNNVFYKFSHWNNNDTAKIRTIPVSQHENITAYYDAINPPSAPQNLSVTESANEHPSLSWTANSEPEVSKYNVYMQEYSNGWDLIGSTDSTGYEDEGVTINWAAIG